LEVCPNPQQRECHRRSGVEVQAARHRKIAGLTGIYTPFARSAEARDHDFVCHATKLIGGKSIFPSTI